MVEIDFDDFWQKYSKVSRIEFACFSFHVGLLFYLLMQFYVSNIRLKSHHRKWRKLRVKTAC